MAALDEAIDRKTRMLNSVLDARLFERDRRSRSPRSKTFIRSSAIRSLKSAVFRSRDDTLRANDNLRCSHRSTRSHQALTRSLGDTRTLTVAGSRNACAVDCALLANTVCVDVLKGRINPMDPVAEISPDLARLHRAARLRSQTSVAGPLWHLPLARRCARPGPRHGFAGRRSLGQRADREA